MEDLGKLVGGSPGPLATSFTWVAWPACHLLHCSAKCGDKKFDCIAGSQVFTRLATFGLNQIITRSLSVEVFGV